MCVKISEFLCKLTCETLKTLTYASEFETKKVSSFLLEPVFCER